MSDWYTAPPITPRDLDPNPRCTCKSDDPRNGHPMLHPAHRSGPCQVTLPGGERCPHEEPTPPQVAQEPI
jgi:hypothetical protein